MLVFSFSVILSFSLKFLFRFLQIRHETCKRTQPRCCCEEIFEYVCWISLSLNFKYIESGFVRAVNYGGCSSWRTPIKVTNLKTSWRRSSCCHHLNVFLNSVTAGLILPSSLSFFLSGSSRCLSPRRSEGYPPYGFQPMGSAPAADPAPTWLDAPRPPLHPGPPPVHQPIARALHGPGGAVGQSAGCVPIWQPQGKKNKTKHGGFYFGFILFICFLFVFHSLVYILPFPPRLIPVIPLSSHHTHTHTIKSNTQTHTHTHTSFCKFLCNICIGCQLTSWLVSQF